MNSKRKLLISITLIIFLAAGAAGQSLSGDYKAAVGIRAGETSGVTFKFRTGSASNIELLGGIWSDWLSLTALYERNVQAFNVNGLRWYYGGGGHVAFATGTYNSGRLYTRGSDFAVGVDGVVGLEYKIPPIPFAISVDIKPLVEIYRNGDVWLGIDPGIGIKFTF